MLRRTTDLEKVKIKTVEKKGGRGSPCRNRDGGQLWCWCYREKRGGGESGSVETRQGQLAAVLGSAGENTDACCVPKGSSMGSEPRNK
jgi:hypothetical protein